MSNDTNMVTNPIGKTQPPTLWCIAWLLPVAILGGCASLPSKPAPPIVKVEPVSTQTATIQQTISQPVTESNAAAPIEQVGFKERLQEHVQSKRDCGCQFGPCAGECQAADCGPINCGPANCGPMVPVMPMMPKPWYYDPQEFLCDGGDHDPHAALTRSDQIIGLQPEDTVSHYTTEDGDIEFTASNRVCVYSPRFGSVRRITGAILNDHAIAASGVARPVGALGVNYDQPGLVMTDTVEIEKAEFTHRIDSMRDRNRGVRIENIQQLEMAGDVLAVLANIDNLSLVQIDEAQLAVIEKLAIAASAWTVDESVEVEILDLKAPILVRDQKVDALVVYEFPDAGRLNLIKLADKQHAAIGEEVTFALRLQNVGDSAVSNVAVTDNLTTRLDYVVGSQTSSAKAQFTTKTNDAGSTQLIWEIQEELGVGDSVTIEFKCRVR